ncbi:hypothetical protein DRP05_09495 [Archaeoglobales archaeon]|nr:MAG: hypothetical protein DRP05_09495 [Archaeoglobales archaeon]
MNILGGKMRYKMLILVGLLVTVMAMSILVTVMAMSIASAQPWGAKGKDVAGDVGQNQQDKEQNSQNQNVQHSKPNKQSIAEKIKEKIKERERREKYKNFAENYVNAKKKFEEAKKTYFAKRGFNNTKKYLYHWADMAENWMERLRNKINNSRMSDEDKAELLDQLDEYIAVVEESKQKVESAENVTELREAIKEMKQNWEEIRKGLRSIVGQIIVGEMKAIVERAELLQLRLEARIEEMNQAGVDTKDLKKILDELSNNLDAANEDLSQAKDAFKSSDVAGGYAKIEDAKKDLGKAFGAIKKFVKAMKTKTGRVFYGYESGEVWAAGNGSAVIEGSVLGLARASGSVNVTPSGAVVSAVGFECELIDDTYACTGTGKVNFRGKGILVEIEGENVKLFAKGYGNLTLNGTGVYRVKRLPNETMTDLIPYNNTNNTIVRESFGEEGATPPFKPEVELIISDVNVTYITDSSATITWKTNVNSNSIVKYGTQSGNYTFDVSVDTSTIDHSVTLTGLSNNTTYYFVVVSESDSLTAQSSEYSFTTLE